MIEIVRDFRPLPANYKSSCNATSSGTSNWNYLLHPSSKSRLTNTRSQSTTIYVNDFPYTIIRLLSEGLYSRVYAAFDSRTGQSVAIKMVQNLDSVHNHENWKMFFKEIHYLLKLQSCNPYIIRVYNYEFDHISRTGKIVMETGHDLRFMLPLRTPSNQKQLTIPQAKFYWHQMVEAVALLHQHGIVHSDIKPENFILTHSGQLRIIDLGLSFRLPPTRASILRPFAGTPEYMSPEACQIQNGQYSHQGRASDVWALGVLLFEMIFGYRPFEHIHDNYDKMSYIARLRQNPIIPPTSSKHLHDVLQQCLQINPARRPNTEQLLRHPFLSS